MNTPTPPSIVERLERKAARGGIIPIGDVTIEEAAATIKELAEALNLQLTKDGPHITGAEVVRRDHEARALLSRLNLEGVSND